jgi:hypothetical protein
VFPSSIPRERKEKLGFILFSMMIRVSCSSNSRRGRPILLLEEDQFFFFSLGSRGKESEKKI